MGGTIRQQLMATVEGTVESLVMWTPRVVGGLVLLLLALVGHAR